MCIMFVNQQAFGDFKENVTSLAPGKASAHNSKKGLKTRSLNSFDSSTNVCHGKKTDLGLKNVNVKKVIKDKENLQPLKPKFKVPDIKVESCSDDPWSDIEDMHISVESEDDYEDIMPKCERIQKKDIDCLFFNYTSPEFIEQTVDRLPSPLKDDQNTYIPDIYIPEFSPLIENPDISLLLYDDTELEPLPDI